jgi:hypothetical protein
VGQLAETVHERVDEFLLAVGFDKRFVAAAAFGTKRDRDLGSSALYPPNLDGIP